MQFFCLTATKYSVKIVVCRTVVCRTIYRTEVRGLQKNFVSMELRRISNLCMRYMDNHAHKKYIDTITGTNGWIIGYLGKKEGEDVFQRDLERKFDITRSTASKVINLMVSKGLIKFEAVNYDARLKKLVLTDKAKDLVSIMHNDADMLEAKLVKGISEEELKMFLNCIEKMKNNLKEDM